MKYYAKSTLILLILFNFITFITSDLPVHCISKNTEGTWLLHLGDNSSDKDLQCGHHRPDQNLDHLKTEEDYIVRNKFETIIHLEMPNYVWSASDKSKQIGKWTMVYDEGFEFEIYNQIFFAFSKYQQVSTFEAKNTDTEDTPGYQSECDKTLVGWYHNSKTNSNWGCFWAEKLTKENLSKYNTRLIEYENIFKYQRVPLLAKVKDKASSNNIAKNNNFLKIQKEERYNSHDTNNLLGLMEELAIEPNIAVDTGISGFPNGPVKLPGDNNMITNSDNYSDLVKSFRMRENAKESYNSGMYSNIPHLDIYFLNKMNMHNNDQSNSFGGNFLEVNLSSKIFEPDYSFVSKVNHPMSKYRWKAKVYDEFIGKTYSQMRSLLGNQKNPIGNFVTPNPKNFLELEIKVHYTEIPNKAHNKVYDYLPSSFSWANINGESYDSPVRIQGHCGSCYSIAAISVVESRIRIYSNNRLKPILSPSSVLACSRYNQGCAGGYPYLVGKFAKEFGLVEESCDPYTEEDDKCRDHCFNQKKWKIKSYGYVGGYYGGCSEEEMKKEIYSNGPIVVAINATPELYYYEKGIFDSAARKKEGLIEKNVKPWEYTNHAVVCIGWGEELVNDNIEKFWILKNSWGDQWGENGYFRMLRGSDNGSVEAQGVYLQPDLD